MSVFALLVGFLRTLICTLLVGIYYQGRHGCELSNAGAFIYATHKAACFAWQTLSQSSPDHTETLPALQASPLIVISTGLTGYTG